MSDSFQKGMDDIFSHIFGGGGGGGGIFGKLFKMFY